MRAITGSRATLLALLCAGLGAALWIELRDMPESVLIAEASGAPGVPEPAAPEEPDPAVPPLAVYATVIERPLFSPTRRPPPAPQPAEAGPARMQGMTLKGIVLSPHRRISLIETAGAGLTPQRIAEGERVQGWSLKAVQPDHVVLRQGEVVRRLELRTGSGSSASAVGTGASREPEEEQLAEVDTDMQAQGALREPETGSRLARAIRMLRAATAGSGHEPR
jgi:hypothetical protein